MTRNIFCFIVNGIIITIVLTGVSMVNELSISLAKQIAWLFILAIPVACISWTVTQEEIFREPHEYCVRLSREGKTLITRKFFFMLSCEYCFSHYITILMLLLTRYQLLLEGWVGYMISGLALVWIANFYLGLFRLLRLGIKHERIETTLKEEELKDKE